MTKTLLTIASLTILIASTLGCAKEATSEDAIPSGDVTLSRVDVSPKVVQIPSGVVVQYSATAIYSNGTTTDVTSSAIWSSSDASIVYSVSGQLNGEMKTGVPGSVTISASYNSHEGSTVMSVSAATLVSIEINPVTPSIPNGITESFSATGHYSDNSTVDLTQTVTWASSDNLIVSMSNTAGTRGIATSHATGSVLVSATLGAVTSNTSLTVSTATLSSIAVTPAHSTIPLGTSTQLQAIGYYTDGTTQDISASVDWSSSDSFIADVSDVLETKGMTTGSHIGTAMIVATLGSVSGDTTLHVSSAELVSIALTPPSPSVPSGLSQQLTITGTFTDGTTQDVTIMAVWSSSDPSVAVVNNGGGLEGLVNTLMAGTTEITANVSGIISSVTVTVTPTDVDAP